MNSPCPICGKDGCKTYPLMVERFAAGRDVEHWRLIHDRLNGRTEDGGLRSEENSFRPHSSALRPSPDPWLPLIRACDDHNPGCCAHPAAFCTRFVRDTTREQCIRCLRADGISPATQ